MRPATGPAKGETEKFAQLLSVITVLALLSALVLISNTMTTLVAEQTQRDRDHARHRRPPPSGRARLRADGVAARCARRRSSGSGSGSSSRACSQATSARCSGRSMSASASIRRCSSRASSSASSAPPLAALPAIRRALRIDLREALEAKGSAIGGQDAADRLLRHAGFLPRTMQIGLRNMGRRKRRSLATALDRRARGRQPARGPRPRGRSERRSTTDVLGRPPRGRADLDRRTSALRRTGRADDPIDPGSCRGGARSQEHRRARRPGGVRLGCRARAAPAVPAGRGPLVQRRRGAGTRAGRRDRAQHRADRRGRASATGSRSRPRRATPSSGSSASPTTSRRTEPPSTSR